ncbi:hypothetical protein NC651_038383 [Populus alba x Populus x berolinensis]|nr:hypothetical protein NC651_038383 [Populus alba x Populus x berolinensis]
MASAVCHLKRCLACSHLTTLPLEPWDLVRKRRRYSRQITLLPSERRPQCFKTRTVQQFPGRPWLSQGSLEKNLLVFLVKIVMFAASECLFKSL